jgi:hypothetical protein
MDIRKFFQPKLAATNITISMPTEASPAPKRIRVNPIPEHEDNLEVSCVDLDIVISKISPVVRPSVCSNEQFERWKGKWSWLKSKSIEGVKDDGVVGVSCAVCSTVGSLKTTAFTTERIEVEKRWISGINAKNSKKLHDKIWEHQASKAHQLCEAQLRL